MCRTVFGLSLLRRPILPPERNAEQLERIAEPARRHRVVSRILPRNCGPHPLMMGMAKAMTLPDASPPVHLESQYSGTPWTIRPS
ncbi:Scr1 family TA system antitoxin-like transcriptional regulator [Streptomyces sp. NPDC058632]|uniref:Scr1 family TA system antitoxin-like transcriptional regulator n=1 Tax=unclassified Streptomyces TaxID=2593676 RepID=UPI003659A618